MERLPVTLPSFLPSSRFQCIEIKRKNRSVQGRQLSCYEVAGLSSSSVVVDVPFLRDMMTEVLRMDDFVAKKNKTGDAAAGLQKKRMLF